MNIIGLGTKKYYDDVVRPFVKTYGGNFKKSTNGVVGQYDKTIWENFTIDEWIKDKTPIVIMGCLRGTEEVVWKAKKLKIPYYYCDHAYFYRANNHIKDNILNDKFYRITKDNESLNYLLNWNENNIAKSRIDKFKKLKPISIHLEKYRNSGDDILVLPPTDAICRLYHYGNTDEWIFKTCQEIKKHTDRKIIIKKKDDTTSLEKYFSKTYCMISSQTTAVISGLLNGIPSICEDISFATPVSKVNISDINNLHYPTKDELENWVNSLLSAQFSLDEIENGVAKKLVEDLQSV